MSSQIIRIAPLQAAKVAAILYFIIGAVFMIPMAIFTMAISASPGAGQGPGWGFIIAMPFIYAIMGFIFVPIMCWIYNLVASWVGGFEITLQ